MAIIRFDNRDKKVNTLSFALMHEAKVMWENDVHNNSDIKSIVFTSGKESGFIAGAVFLTLVVFKINRHWLP